MQAPSYRRRIFLREKNIRISMAIIGPLANAVCADEVGYCRHNRQMVTVRLEYGFEFEAPDG